MSSGSGRSVTAGHGHLVWSLAAIILALIAPFGELPALSSDRYWLFGDEYTSILLPPVLIGVAAVACAITAFGVTLRNRKGRVLPIVAVVISGLVLAFMVLTFFGEMGADSTGQGTAEWVVLV
jgi:uncharacterized membrane protein